VAAVVTILRSKKGITAIGNAQVDTAQSKFGGASLLLDGTGDYLSSTTPISLGTEDWTVETWIRTGTANRVFFDNRIPTASAGVFFLSASGYASYYDNTTGTISGTTNCADSTWRHLAFSKSGTTLRIFVNGALEYTATGYTQDMGTDRSCTIGAQFDGAIAINGHMDEFRISNVARYTAAFVAPTLPFSNDDNTVLLIHANSTDGTTYFEDDNGATTIRTAKTIVANGNAQLSTAQEKFGGSSILFDGSGDYLQLDTFGPVAGSNQNFTIEMWIRWNSLTGGQGITSDRPPTTENFVATNFYLEKNSSNTFFFGYKDNGDIINTSSVAANTWYHLAVVRNLGTTTLYLNGTATGNTLSYTGIVGDGSLSIGAVVGQYMNGYIDEFRISNVARYTANFTAPTTTFENDANTLLLIHAEGANASTTITDDNSGRSPRALIAQGNAQLDTAQSKFGGSALLCDGTGDYVMSPAGSQWDFGTSSFTIEYWIRFNVAPTLYVPIALRSSSSIFNGEWWCEITNAEKKMYWGFKNYAGTQYYVNLALAGTAFATGQWYHIALVNNAGTAQMYVNGTATGATTALSGSFGISTTDLWIGAGAGAYSLNGWMDEVRISNTARYTSGFTPSTTPFVNDANTLLLLHADGTDASTVFRDDNGIRNQKSALAIGTAKISTAQSKFGGSSSIYNGSANGIISRKIATFGTGDFTIEGWIRSASLATENYYVFDCRNTIDGTQAPGANLAVIYSGTSNISFFTGGNVLIGSTSYTADTWHHFALVRSSGVAQFYFNGVGSGNSHALTTNFAECDITFGSYAGATGGGDFIGYIDEMRVSNIARYTANFTAPTAQFQNDDNTLLLLHCDGANNSTIFFDDNGVKPYTPT
jgi:hypothetical protein